MVTSKIWYENSSSKGQILFFVQSLPYSLRNCLFACYRQLESLIFKKLTFSSHLAPQEESNGAYMTHMTPLFATY